MAYFCRSRWCWCCSLFCFKIFHTPYRNWLHKSRNHKNGFLIPVHRIRVQCAQNAWINRSLLMNKLSVGKILHQFYAFEKNSQFTSNFSRKFPQHNLLLVTQHFICNSYVQTFTCLAHHHWYYQQSNNNMKM